MDMSLQTIYFIVGVAGFVLATAFAVAAVVYFLRADIRAVLADLSGKARAAELAEFTISRGGRGSKKSVLTSNDEWSGGISHGDLAARSGSDAITEDPSLSGSSSGGNSDWSYSDSVVAEQDESEEDAAETVVDAEAASQPEMAPMAPMAPVAQDASAGDSRTVATAGAVAGKDGSQFTIVRQIISVHSRSVIDEQGNEVVLDAFTGGDR